MLLGSGGSSGFVPVRHAKEYITASEAKKKRHTEVSYGTVKAGREMEKETIPYLVMPASKSLEE